MTGKTLQILVAMTLYMATVIAIGVHYARRASASSGNFLLGGRSLGPWITAMGAEASDMSGWLLMGLPGVAYFYGLSDALWTAVGLLAGTYLNWLLVAKRIRNYTAVAGDAITIPDFISNRFHERRKILLTIAALFILVFFTVYAASCFVTVGKLFHALFGFDYRIMMFAGAFFVISYTLIGGFLAESASDLMQGIVMIAALAAVLVAGVAHAGGLAAVLSRAQAIPGFCEFFGVAQPTLENGVQRVAQGQPVFGAAAPYRLLALVSTLSWGLGYFGMPQVLLKFMGIRRTSELQFSRRVATAWCALSLFAAVAIGIIGRVLYPTVFLTQNAAEGIFIHLSDAFFFPLLAGFVMAGILAATISSSDSYLLIAASAFSKNLYHGLLKRDASDRTVLIATRATLLVVALVAMFIALDENNRIIFSVVSFAWAGFGATFGPVILFALFWRRTTRAGAMAGLLAGGGTVFLWKLAVRPLGGIWNVYELLPAFLVSVLAITIGSLLSRPPDAAVCADFDRARSLP